MKKKKPTIPSIIKWVIALILVVMQVYPFFYVFTSSFKSLDDFRQLPAYALPSKWVLTNFINVFTKSHMLTYFKNSIIISVGAVAVSVMFSCLAGYGVTRFRFKGKESFLGFILMTQMFPSIMLLIPYYKVLDMYGLKDSLVGMMCVYISFTIPFCSWMMVGFFRTIPLELDEAAIIDGCSRWKAFYKITLPMTLPGISSSAIYAFITAWNEYMFAQVLIISPELKTLPLGIAELNGFYKILWNDLMAASVIASLPLIILFIFLQKYFISGLTAGAVKQ